MVSVAGRDIPHPSVLQPNTPPKVSGVRHMFIEHHPSAQYQLGHPFSQEKSRALQSSASLRLRSGSHHSFVSGSRAPLLLHCFQQETLSPVSLTVLTLLSLCVSPSAQCFSQNAPSWSKGSQVPPLCCYCH